MHKIAHIGIAALVSLGGTLSSVAIANTNGGNAWHALIGFAGSFILWYVIGLVTFERLLET